MKDLTDTCRVKWQGGENQDVPFSDLPDEVRAFFAYSGADTLELRKEGCLMVTYARDTYVYVGGSYEIERAKNDIGLPLPDILEKALADAQTEERSANRRAGTLTKRVDELRALQKRVANASV